MRVERYWSHIYRQADEVPQPGFTPYAGMAAGVATELDDAASQTWLQQALASTTAPDDTHPALTERLKAIGESPHLASPEPGQAADRLLGPALARITEALDRRWQENIQSSWAARHREVQEGRRRLAELDAKHDGGTELTPQEAFDRAMLTEGFGNEPDKALAQLRELHQRNPDDPVLCYNLGIHMLNRDDAAGDALLERAMELDEDRIVRGARAARRDRKSTRLNSSHQIISYAVFCLKKKKNHSRNAPFGAQLIRTCAF